MIINGGAKNHLVGRGVRVVLFVLACGGVTMIKQVPDYKISKAGHLSKAGKSVKVKRVNRRVRSILRSVSASDLDDRLLVSGSLSA